MYAESSEGDDAYGDEGDDVSINQCTFSYLSTLLTSFGI